jgi:hypothetical protein
MFFSIPFDSPYAFINGGYKNDTAQALEENTLKLRPGMTSRMQKSLGHICFSAFGTYLAANIIFRRIFPLARRRSG